MSPGLLFFLLPAFAVIACAGGSSAFAGSRAGANQIVLEPAKFTRLPRGWRAFDSDFGLLTPSGDGVESYALSWAYKPNSFGWANAMPRYPIAVQVLVLRTRPDDLRINLCLHTPHVPGFPEIQQLPLCLRRTTGSRLEGAPRVPEYRVFGRIGDLYNVDLRVEINNATPTTAMLRTAQRVVGGLRFPTWPRRERC